MENLSQNCISLNEPWTKRKSRRDEFLNKEKRPTPRPDDSLQIPRHFEPRIYSPPFYSCKRRSSTVRLRGSGSQVNTTSINECQDSSLLSNSLPRGRLSQSPLSNSRRYNQRSPRRRRGSPHPKKYEKRSSSVSLSKVTREDQGKVSVEGSERRVNGGKKSVRRRRRHHSDSSADSSSVTAKGEPDDDDDDEKYRKENTVIKFSDTIKDISSSEKKSSSSSSPKPLPTAELNLYQLAKPLVEIENKSETPKQEKRQRSGTSSKCCSVASKEPPCCSKPNSPILVAEQLRKAMQDRKIIDCDRWFGKRSMCQPTVKSWLACLGYLINDCIGVGPYSEVFCADDALGKNGKVAVKTLRLAPLYCHGLDRCFIREQILRWAKLKHPNIVTLYDGLIGQKKAIYIMEFACCGDLYHQLLCEEEWKLLLPLMARKWTWQMVLGLAYLHEQCIPHQDLKLENILLFCNKDAKISDPGLARIYRDPCRPKKCCRLYIGTNAYIAPEVLRGGSSCSMPADMWSLGVILFALWNRCLPYPTNLCDEELANLQSEQQLEYKTENCGCIEEMAAQLIKSLLCTDPCMRPSSAQVKQNCLFKKIPKKM